MVCGCFAWAAERLVFGVEVRFARSSFIFLYAVLAGLGSCLGGVWLFRMGCREVGFWCGGAFCTVEVHLSLGHQKVALESFLALRFWLVWAAFCTVEFHLSLGHQKVALESFLALRV